MRAVCLAVCLVVLVCSLAAAVPVTGKVRDAAGQPLVGVKVYVLVLSDRRSESFRAPSRVVTTGADGAFALDWPLAPEKVSYAMVVAYRPGLAVDFASGQTLKPLDFVLKPTVPTTGSVLDADGKPLAGARVTLAACYERADDSYKHGQIPPVLQDILAVKTDANGQYTLNCVARDVRPTMAIKAAGYGEVQVSFERQVEPVRLERPGMLRGQLTCADPAVKLGGWTITAYGDIPSARGYGSAMSSGVTNGAGQFGLPQLPPAEYRVSVVAPAGAGYGARWGKATVASGQTAEVKLALEKLLPVRGRIVAAGTRKALPNINVNGDPGGQTAADGRFTLMCLPGKFGIYAYDRANNYRSTDSQKQYTLAAPGLDVGDIALSPAYRVTVLVVDAAGQPIPKAMVSYKQSGAEYGPFDGNRLPTDEKGCYTLKGLTGGTVVITAMKGALSSEPAEVDPKTQRGPVKMVLLPGKLAILTAILRDQDGKPVTDANVRMYEQTQQYGRERTVPPADAEGRITGECLTPGAGYSFKIEAPDCWPAETPKWTAVVGETHDCGVVTVTRNRGFVAGKVVDAAGQPVSGMIVTCTLEAPRPVTTTSGADGSFRLEGLSEGPVCVLVHGGGIRGTAQMVKTGTTDAVLKAPGTGPLTWGAGEAAAVTGASPEALKQSQALLLEALEKTKGGEYWSRWMLLLALAKRDPQLALQTAAACGDKDESLRAVVAMNHLLDAPQEAKLILQALDPEQAQQGIMYVLGWRIANVTPPLGVKIGEALLDLAARQRGYDGVCGRAIAMRWLLKYDPARAEALIPDLLARAQRLGVAEREAMARGMAAEVVATKNPEAALELVKPIPDENEAQRYTAKLAPCIAATNPQKALELLRGLKQEWDRDRNMPECLAAFPAAQRELALAEARKLQSGTAKARALGKLAQLCPREQAPALIAEAAEGLIHCQARPYVDVSEEVGSLLTLGILAHRLGCADYREIMWRGLTLYTASAAYDSSGVQRGLTQMATRLALADPALSRHILEVTLQRIGDWTKAEGYTQRSLINAAAESDPQWALVLMRQMPPTQKPDDRNWWSDAMTTVAQRLAQGAEEQETNLLHDDSMGWSWLAEDDSVE